MTFADTLALQSTPPTQIELLALMRAKNLVGLDLGHHSDIVSPERCQKSEYVLGPAFMRLFNLYRNVYRSLLADGRRQIERLEAVLDGPTSRNCGPAPPQGPRRRSARRHNGDPGGLRCGRND